MTTLSVMEQFQSFISSLNHTNSTLYNESFDGDARSQNQYLYGSFMFLACLLRVLAKRMDMPGGLSASQFINLLDEHDVDISELASFMLGPCLFDVASSAKVTPMDTPICRNPETRMACMLALVEVNLLLAPSREHSTISTSVMQYFLDAILVDHQRS